MMALPSALRPLTEQPRWVGWRWVVRNGKQDKPLFRAYSPTQHASTQDPTTWSPFRSAIEALQAQRVDGIGYVVRDDAAHIFIDLDDCRNPQTGELQSWAQRLVEDADSYTEITPSGCGIRIIGLAGSISAPIHTSYKLLEGGHGEVFYRAVRYVTVTGNRLHGTLDAMRDISDVTLDLLASAGRANATGEAHSSNPEPHAPIEDIAAALAAIPNADVHWDDWVRVGLATWRASGGSEAGREAWRDWSVKSGKHSDADLDDKWAYFRRSPPTKIGFGSLFYMARQADADFVPPTWHVGPQGEGISIGKVARQERPQGPLPVIHFDDVEPNLDAADFIEGLLIEGAMSVIYGPSNCGKTFFCTDLALHVAAGWAWRGREVEAGGVIYCALEGAHGIKNRVAAFKRHHGILSGLPFGIVPVTLNLLDPEADTDRLIETIRAQIDRMGVPVRWIILDTLSRAMSGGNENSPEDMGALVTNGTRIQQETGAHVTWIHHSGKDDAKGARGHSLLRAATDTEIEISRADTVSPSVARVTKQRELEIDGEFVFRLAPVELGTNRRGKAVTSCVVEVVEGDAPARTRPLSDGAKEGLKALQNTLSKYGKPVTQRDIPDGVPVVHVELWREEFRAKSVRENDEATRKAFTRAFKDLAAAKRVATHSKMVWMVRVEDEQI